MRPSKTPLVLVGRAALRLVLLKEERRLPRLDRVFGRRPEENFKFPLRLPNGAAAGVGEQEEEESG